MSEITLWRDTSHTWEGLEGANIQLWTRSDGKVGRVNVSSVKMAGGLGQAFADVELTGDWEKDDELMREAAFAAWKALEDDGGPFGARGRWPNT